MDQLSAESNTTSLQSTASSSDTTITQSPFSPLTTFPPPTSSAAAIPANSLTSQVDLGAIVQAANGSFESLKRCVAEVSNECKFQYLTSHFKPSIGDTVHSHPVTKCGKSWTVPFQLKWLRQFPWLAYSGILAGGICRYCILFPSLPQTGEEKIKNLVLTAYQKPYTKVLGKDGVLVTHEQTAMHKCASEKADLFSVTFQNPARRVDVALMEEQRVQAEENREVLRCIVLAVEYLAKQGLSFRSHRDDKVDFSASDANRGNFIVLLQLMAKESMVLQRYLSFASGNSRYTSKTIQNEIIHIYSCAVKEKLTKVLREQNFPFTIIADEVTDPHANQEILLVCIRFVDISSEPQIRECFIGFLYLDRANAKMISEKILECIADPSISLDPTCIRGQAYDGAAVMASDIAGIQAKIKDISPLAVYTHCYAHCLNLSIAAACKAQEVRNLIGLINEIYLFLNNSPKRQRAFELTLQVHLPDSNHKKLAGMCKTRWVERQTCLEVFLELYESVVIFLDSNVSPNDYPDLLSAAGKWDWDRETRVRAEGLKASLQSFQTIATFIITKNILEEVRPLASKFQKRERYL